MFKHYFELVENVAIWPIISLAIFFAFFLSLLVWVFTTNKQLIEEMAQKPMEDGTIDTDPSNNKPTTWKK